MNYDYPITVEISGKVHNIRNECDYRMVLDCIEVLNDDELSQQAKIYCALYIFYEDVNKIDDFETATKEMFRVINNGEYAIEESEKPQVMDWQHDFKIIAPPVSRIIGYDVRTPNKYTHWWSFLSAYMEIGDCLFANVVSIRTKIQKGKNLEKYEREFYSENRNMIDLPKKLNSFEQQWLNDLD